MQEVQITVNAAMGTIVMFATQLMKRTLHVKSSILKMVIVAALTFGAAALYSWAKLPVFDWSIVVQVALAALIANGVRKQFK